MIISASEPPQYIVVSLTDRELKDRFIYRNKYLTIKTSIQTAFFLKIRMFAFCYVFEHLTSPNIL